MGLRYLNIFVVFLMLSGLVWAGVQEASTPDDMGQNQDSQTVSALVDDQLEINREALLRGSSKAALLMLTNGDVKSRSALISVLNKADNKPAVTAVCDALAQVDKGTIANLQDFQKPLLQLLHQEDPQLGSFAADSCLLFPYSDIGSELEAMAKDETLSSQARLNAVKALQLQPNKQAVITLLDLVDAQNKAVSVGAVKSLNVLGVPVGENPAARQKHREYLQHKSKDEFLRDYILEQEKRIQKVRNESDSWRSLYLEALDKLYSAITDDTMRSEFLVQQMRASQNERRRWALLKAGDWRRAAGTNLPADMSPVLLALIADKDRSVRLATARLLSKMGEVSSAKGLLDQLEVEQDKDVRMALFVALGMACDYAMLLEGGKGTPVPVEVKRRTLEWAGTFLSDSDPNYIREGADVVRKLLEKNGLSDEEEQTYLVLLKERFLADSIAQNVSTRADLLQAMAGLCLARSACKDKAVQLYSPLFAEFHNHANDRIRQNAIEGLLGVDKLAALRQLRKDSSNDTNPAIRTQLIEAAINVGEVEDLEWLVLRLSQGQEGIKAWQAMTTILGRLEAVKAIAWLKTSLGENSPFAYEQVINLLQLIEKKAVGDEHAASRSWILGEQISLYRKAGDQEALAKALQKAMTSDPGSGGDAYDAELLKIQLELGQVDEASGLLIRCLSKRDVGEEDPLAQVIQAFLESADKAQQETVQAILKVVSPVEARPQWNACVAKWSPKEKAGNSVRAPKKP